MTHYSVFLTALFLSMLLVGLLIRYAAQLGLVDVPDSRKVHKGLVPRVGGIGMVIGTAGALLIWLAPQHELRAFLLGVVIIATFGVWDDRADLDYKLKFGGQLLAVLVVVFFADARIDHLSLLHGESLPSLFSIPLTIFFLLGVTNAVNLADGLDGIAAGMSLLSLACMVVLATGAEHSADLVLPMLAVMGATLGFLRYNTHPAMVFMGDAGSQFLGFSLGVFALWLTQNVNTALVPELPLLALGLPVIDTLTVMTQRILAGKSPFKPDKNHFHHKLLNLGLDHYEAVLAIYLVQGTFVALAYLMRYEATASVLLAYFGLSVLLIAGYPVAKTNGWHVKQTQDGDVSVLTRRVMSRTRWFLRVAYLLITTLVLALMVSGSLLKTQMASDIGYFGIAIAICSFIATIMRLSLEAILQRLTIYTCAILSVFAMDAASFGELIGFPEIVGYSITVLAILVALGVRYSDVKYFSLTPSDYLVMAILIAAAFLPELAKLKYTKLVMESAVLLYGVEYVLRQQGKATMLLWGSASAVFTVVAWRVLA